MYIYLYMYSTSIYIPLHTYQRRFLERKRGRERGRERERERREERGCICVSDPLILSRYPPVYRESGTP
jgi:hypothetical protein